ncbi:MAG: cardiolipin synthase [Ginsengibacter sp.]
MDWLLIGEIIYIVIVILVCLRIVYDTQSTTKTLAYLLFAVFVPFFGMLFYFFFGINYRSRKMYSKKLLENNTMLNGLREQLFLSGKKIFQEGGTEIKSNKELAYLLLNDGMSPLTSKNSVKLLINGENKFPEVLSALREAKNHIHIEYYIFEDSGIGNEIGNILIQKAKEGVKVRFIYDDFGSSSIRKKFVRNLRDNRVEAFPFLKISFLIFANRINYRNHRKIIVIDGHTAFVGGINVSDKYINKEGDAQHLYWRDTHLRIDGPGILELQYLFLCDWNFCANEKIKPDRIFFPPIKDLETAGDKIVQIAASGPDSKIPTILFSLMQAINLATKEILITTPYFIPGESLIDAVTIASLSGLSVKLLVPDKSDSILVNAAARSYYDDLLNAGVEIYLYQKGFVHAKTLVADRKVAVVGTANMDFRSFDLNFEVNAIVYDSEIANQLADVFYNDIKFAKRIDEAEWSNRSRIKQLGQKTARLLSPLL